ncbi:class I adenylate-forming enzyme family protein [Peribacillus deserti]|uniref:Long-chain fatty acid--CoA ligase n=1 Tax=Peribacillus deserti TaxID=673318 RepID=A0A2N5M5Z3_9BACI|nr:long-chain fatty acid--CoA ligase [Peribacillus deserti]PLT29781.1 long-chain fatty acid--CoA ligase [Peribacillus deserti]
MKLKDLLETNIENFDEYPFLYHHGLEFTNVEVKSLADGLACGLHSLGIHQGDRVIVCMPNCPEVIISYQGITRAGAIIVPVMFTLHTKEIQYIIQNSGAKAVITSSLVAEKVEKAMEKLPVRPVLILIDQPKNERAYNFYDVTQYAKEENTLNTEVKPEDTAVILYTSGTTGNPKGVLLTHKNLYSNAYHSAVHHETERGTTLGILPLAHVFGLTVSNICFLTGSSIVVFSKFDPSEVCKAIETYKVKNFSAVPAMIHALLSYPAAEQYNTSSLEWISSGSAPLPLALLHAFQQKFGVQILEGYGLSEAAPVVTAHSRSMPVKPGSVGIPIPGVQIKIVNDSGKELPAGEVGELIVSGDNVTPGYFQNQEETWRVLKDGWLFTGDLGRVDEDGYLFIVDRKKDLIIRGGFNVYPRDIEEILTGHSGVQEAAVVGIPDERMGEEMVACIVAKQGTDVTEEELIQYCGEFLAKNKTPRKVLFLEALPRNGVGKILKTRLRSQAAEMITLS